MLDLSTNWQLMEEIAQQSGGRVVRAEKAAELLEDIRQASATRSTTVEQKLWQSWWSLALFVVLLACEWGVRKWAGLP
jgi:hypothetical protein